MAVVLKRTLQLTNPMMRGTDVKQVQALLTRVGLPCIEDGVFGAATGKQCVAAKVALKYPKAEQYPSCGPPLVQKLEALKKPFPPPVTPPARTRFIATLNEFFAERSNWDYSQSRPFPLAGHTGRVRTDCSGGLGYAASVAKCPSPNGHTPAGYGFTGTMLNSCERISLVEAIPGDLVVFGYYPGHHAAAFLQPGTASDPILWSHGRQGDPRKVPLSDELRWQPRGVAFLRFIHD